MTCGSCLPRSSKQNYLAYLVWLVAEARLEWFCLEDDDYRPQLPDAQGLLHSRVFPGLRVPIAPLLAGDTANVLAALSQKEANQAMVELFSRRAIGGQS